MKNLTRRHFIQSAALGGAALTLTPSLFAGEKDDPNRFQIGIQEYTFHRWIGSGKLKHLDYPALAKEKLGRWPTTPDMNRPMIVLMRWAEQKQDPMLMQKLIRPFAAMRRKSYAWNKTNEQFIKRWEAKLTALWKAR